MAKYIRGSYRHGFFPTDSRFSDYGEQRRSEILKQQLKKRKGNFDFIRQQEASKRLFEENLLGKKLKTDQDRLASVFETARLDRESQDKQIVGNILARNSELQKELTFRKNEGEQNRLVDKPMRDLDLEMGKYYLERFKKEKSKVANPMNILSRENLSNGEYEDYEDAGVSSLEDLYKTLGI